MPTQIPLSEEAIVNIAHPDEETTQIADDLSYRRLLMVNVVFYGAPEAGDRGWVMIDTGMPGLAGKIESAAEARFGKGARPAAIVLTHGHFDHSGNVEKLAREWDAPILAHPLEFPYLNGTTKYPPADWRVGGGLMPLFAPLFPSGPINVSNRLTSLPEDGSIPFMPGWKWMHTPGHSPGHISLWREADRALIVGDAFITTNMESAYAVAVQAPELHGPPQFLTPDWAAARESVEKLAALDPALVVSGHGRAMRGPEMLGALRALARDFDEIAVPRPRPAESAPARPDNGRPYRGPA